MHQFVPVTVHEILGRAGENLGGLDGFLRGLESSEEELRKNGLSGDGLDVFLIVLSPF